MGFLLDGVHPSDQFGLVNFIPFEGMPPMEGPVARQFQHGTLGCRFATAFQHGLEVPSKVRMANLTSSTEQLFVWLPSISMKDAREALSPQILGLITTPAGQEPEHLREARSSRPQPHPIVAALAKPGLIGMSKSGSFNLSVEILMGLRHGLAGGLAAGLHGPEAHIHADQQPHQGLGFTTAQSEPARQHGHHGLDARAECAFRGTRRHLSPRKAAALRATLLPEPEFPDKGLEFGSLHDLADVRIQPRRGFQPSTAVRAGFGIQVHDLPDLILGHWIPHRPWMTGLPTRFASGRFLWNLTTAHI
jgi:hypothetical protein